MAPRTDQHDPDPPPVPRVQSVARAAAILAAVGASPAGLKPREISERLDITLPTTYHLLQTLRAVGLLRREVEGRFVLGYEAGALAEGFERQLSIPVELGERVRAVAAETRESGLASGWSGGEIVVLTTAVGDHPVGVAAVPLGLGEHAHARASGKLLLSLAAEDERARYLREHRQVALTSRTLTGSKLERELRKIQAQGYATDEGEFAEGVCCLAVPMVFGSETYALAVSAPEARFRAGFDELHAALKTIATT